MRGLARARKARLSIPRVAQNPRPVGHTYSGLANAVAAKTPATTTAQPSNAATPTTQSEATDPFKAAPSTPQARGLFDIPSYTPQAGQPDPRDATYWQNISKLKFEDEQKYSEFGREQTRADTDYADAVQTAIRNRGLQQRGLGEDAIRGNLGSSGWLNRTEGQQTATYTQERAHAQLNKSEEDQARAAARTALLEGWGIDAAAELAAAGGRYAEGSREEAQNAPGEPGASASGGGSGAGAHAGKGKGRYGIGKGHPAGGGSANFAHATPLPNPTQAALAQHTRAKKGKR